MVVLLFTAVVLTIVVSTTATLALGARGGGVNERAAYQALLAAESGLNTFEARVKAAKKYPQANNQSTLNSWLAANPEFGTYGDATLEVTAQPGSSEITVTSTGRILGGTKIVLQNYKLVLDKRFKFRPRSALSSIPPINATGNAQIYGEANDGVVTSVRGSAVSLPIGGTTVTLPVHDTASLLAGDYIKVSGTTFRIDAKTATSLDLTRVSPAATAINLSGDVTLMLNAVAGTYSTLADPMQIRASNHGDFVVGEKVTVGGKEAVVTRVGPDLDEEFTGGVAPEHIELDWTEGTPNTLPEGMQIFRDITAMRSGGNITPKSNNNGLDNYSMDGMDDCSNTGGNGSNAVITCEGANDPLLAQEIPTGQTFFTQSLFGLTDQQLNELVPLESPLPSPFNMTGEVRRIRASDISTAIEGKVSSGILIVDGDVNSNLNANTTFNGFIYFRGNQGGKFNGNVTVNGGIAVRGGPIEGINSGDDQTTDATGSLVVNYKAAQLRKYFIGNGQKKIESVQGTWRQR